MLSDELNQRMTRVGAGTPTGDLLRRYWIPIAASRDIEDLPVRSVEVLGEKLVLFRDESGTLGLLDQRCPHRGASLAYGFPEPDGLRCPYHGWKFDNYGTCIEQPFEREGSHGLRERGAVRSYPVEELGGLVFAYLGPVPAPVLPEYDLFRVDPSDAVFRDIGFAVVPCNWLQIMENSLDPVHVEWLHGKTFDYHLQQQGLEPTGFGGEHVKIGFEETDYGILKRRLRVGQREDHEDWRVGHPVIFPIMLKVGGDVISQYQIRVPIDDERTLHIWYSVYRIPSEYRHLTSQIEPNAEMYEIPVQDERGRFHMGTIDQQDMMAWASQGPINDRTAEHLGMSDRGIAQWRQMLKKQIDVAESGGDPIGVIRDSDQARIDFPQEDKELAFGGESGNPLAGLLRTQAVYSPAFRQLVSLIDEHNRGQGIAVPERPEMAPAGLSL